MIRTCSRESKMATLDSFPLTLKWNLIPLPLSLGEIQWFAFTNTMWEERSSQISEARPQDPLHLLPGSLRTVVLETVALRIQPPAVRCPSPTQGPRTGVLAWSPQSSQPTASLNWVLLDSPAQSSPGWLQMSLHLVANTTQSRSWIRQTI